MALAAPATVAHVLVAIVEAGATAGHAATPHIAAEDLLTTLPDAPALALAPRRPSYDINHQLIPPARLRVETTDFTEQISMDHLLC